jgi:hypothetical protein
MKPKSKKTPPTEIYEQRYVAFVDILGFAKIVEKSQSDTSLVHKLNKALGGISRRAASARSEKLRLEATTFSDTVVLSVPVTSDGLLHMFQAIDDLSIDLLSMNMLFRGAIVRGMLMHSAEAIFGPALVEAYNLETRVSFHPRIIVGKDVFGDASSEQYEELQLVSRYISADAYDIPYLDLFARWRGISESWAKDSLEKLISLQTIIAAGLIENTENPPVCEKYKWLARKLNSFVRTAKLQNKIGLLDLENAE